MNGRDAIVGRRDTQTVLPDLHLVREIISVIVVFEISDFFWNPKIHERRVKYPDIQLFDLREFYLATKLLPDISNLLKYLTAKRGLSRRHPGFTPYEETLIVQFVSNGYSLDDLESASSVMEAALLCKSKLPSRFLYSATVDEVYAAMRIPWTHNRRES